MKAEILFNLAKRCSVSMHAACVKTDVAYSTTHRWKRGSEPKPETFDKLHHAILQIADEKGTLPEDLRKDLEVIQVAAVDRSPAEIIENIEKDIRDLKKVI